MKTSTKHMKMWANSYSLIAEIHFAFFFCLFIFFFSSLSTYFRVNWSIKTYLGALSYQLGHWYCNVWRASMLAITDVQRLMIVAKIKVPLLTWEYTVSICWNFRCIYIIYCLSRAHTLCTRKSIFIFNLKWKFGLPNYYSLCIVGIVLRYFFYLGNIFVATDYWIVTKSWKHTSCI